MRINTDDQELELHTETGEHRITLNNKPLSLIEGLYQQERSFFIGLINDQQKTIIIKFENFPLYIDYDGNSARIYKPQSYWGIKGICFRH